jgi:hypothetical protein
MPEWLIDPAIHAIDCGDNSCRYATNKTGMRTNGGCRCARNYGDKVERFLLQNYHEALEKIQELESQIETREIDDMVARSFEHFDD